MNIPAVYIVNKKENTLIYLGIIEETFKINQRDLSELLGEINSKAIDLNDNIISKIQIKNNSFLFGNFNKILIIIQYIEIPPSEDLISEINLKFNECFSDLLENYSEKEINKFKSFTEVLNEIIKKFKIFYKDINKIGLLPIINPQERIIYPNGISDYQKDEIFWNEAKPLKEDYPANFFGGLIYEMEIFLSISPKHNYKIIIDFSKYPKKPLITISDNLKKEIEKELNKILFFYKNWEDTQPPHIVELIKELEYVLKIYHAQGKLSETRTLSASSIPEISPLPDIKLKIMEKSNG